MLNALRVVIAHGSWFSGGGASHLNRRTLRTSVRFAEVDEIQKWTQEASRLMSEVVVGADWKYVRKSDGRVIEVGKWP